MDQGRGRDRTHSVEWNEQIPEPCWLRRRGDDERGGVAAAIKGE